jgi:uncharacterized protein (TIGR02145 family)
MKKAFLFAIPAATLVLAACNKGNDGNDPFNPGQIVVNGTTWAARNVAAPGYFTAAVEDYGAYYDYEAAQTACPDGWRTPTQSEWAALLSLTRQVSIRNGIPGLLLNRGGNGASLFLPAAGLTHGGNVTDYVGTDGYYWSGTPSNGYEEPTAWHVHFEVDAGGNASCEVDDGVLYNNGFSVRCVKGANEL